MENDENNNSNNKLKIIYLIILIILLIFTFVISFKTGEKIYNLVNTKPEEDTDSYTEVATWQLEVRIEY